MKEVLISFCEDMSSVSNPDEIRSGTICADFKHELLFFSWKKRGIPASRVKHFSSFPSFDAWRQEVYFGDEDVRWQIFLVNDAGDFTVYISFDSWLPKELEELYALVQSKKR